MFCRRCNIKWQEGITVCPECLKEIEDTHYTQYLERITTHIGPLPKPAKLLTSEKKATKVRLSWQEKRELAEVTETQAIKNYLSNFPMGRETAEMSYFNTFKK